MRKKKKKRFKSGLFTDRHIILDAVFCEGPSIHKLKHVHFYKNAETNFSILF